MQFIDEETRAHKVEFSKISKLSCSTTKTRILLPFFLFCVCLCKAYHDASPASSVRLSLCMRHWNVWFLHFFKPTSIYGILPIVNSNLYSKNITVFKILKVWLVIQNSKFFKNTFAINILYYYKYCPQALC